jgi:hypothetical protein
LLTGCEEAGKTHRLPVEEEEEEEKKKKKKKRG